MKQILVLLLLLPFIGTTQSLPQLIKEYEKHCNQLVLDTTEQVGVVTYDLVPIKNNQGIIGEYTLGSPKDTVWEKPIILEYKFEDRQWITIANDGWFNSTISTSTLTPKTISTVEITISRPYVYELKLRKINAWSEHFWDWCKNYKISLGGIGGN